MLVSPPQAERGGDKDDLCPPEPPGPIDVLGLPVRPLNTEGLIELLVTRARRGACTRACYANAHTVNLACRDARYREVLRGSDVLYADGAAVVWASRWSERRLPERMTAADYFVRFAQRCGETGLSLYLLGGREGVSEKAAARLLAESPGLQIAGTRHGYFGAEASDGIVAAINAAAPDVLVVGMSSPRQEYWLAQRAGGLNVPVRWCVGALFDYLAGAERRAPPWLRRIGGEWLFRLLMDPAGKWRRYLVGNPLFVVNALRWGFRRPHGGSPREATSALEGDGLGAGIGREKPCSKRSVPRSC